MDLGVCIDGELNFDENRHLRIGKANRMVGAIRRAFKFLDRFTFVKLYKAMVRCHLEFAVNVWATYLTKDIRGKKGTYEERLRLLKLLTLHRRSI